MNDTWNSIAKSITDATSEAFIIQDCKTLSGGSINRAFSVESASQRFFVKLNNASRKDMFAAEAAGLSELANTGAIRVPSVIAQGADGNEAWLILEHIALSPTNSDAVLGEQLAAMHRACAPYFGWPRDNTIGSTLQRNTRASNWTDFFRDQRLGFQLALAREHGASHSLLDSGDQVLELMPAFFSDYQPAPSLLHGDLWAGNRGTDEHGAPVIYDPAVYWGDREADVAMTELFGGFGAAFYAAYDAVWPREPGYKIRRDLYNLYHLLNHFNLFGGGYAGQALSVMKGLSSEVA
ncbi:MAG: fructosamine kinase family protein [Pseudomonadota bacterium]